MTECPLGWQQLTDGLLTLLRAIYCHVVIPVLLTSLKIRRTFETYRGYNMKLASGFGPSIGRIFNGYVQFSGRAPRSDYWWFALLSLGVTMIELVPKMEIIGTVWSLAVLLPSLAVSARRLHDVGRSGWWMLICFTGLGVLVFLYWAIRQGDQFDNKYGPQLFMTR